MKRLSTFWVKNDGNLGSSIVIIMTTDKYDSISL